MSDSERDLKLIEQQIASEAIFEGALLDVQRDKVRLPDGSTATREYIVHPGAVMVIPRLPDGCCCSSASFAIRIGASSSSSPQARSSPTKIRSRLRSAS